MLRSFEFLVSGLYSEWEDLLMPSLKPREKAYFQSICDRTATETDVAQSLRELSRFLAEKFSRNVIVLIDEYESPNHYAYDSGYFEEVRSLYPHL